MTYCLIRGYRVKLGEEHHASEQGKEEPFEDSHQGKDEDNWSGVQCSTSFEVLSSTLNKEP
jgi:hypothetical protein